MAVLPRRFPNPPAPVSERRRSAGRSAEKTDLPVPPLDADVAAAGGEHLSAHCAPGARRFPRIMATLTARSRLKKAIGCAPGRGELSFSRLGSTETTMKEQTAEAPALARAGRNAGTVYFSTRIKSPVEALTDTVNFAPSRLAP
jgi:hypothetical protein